MIAKSPNTCLHLPRKATLTLTPTTGVTDDVPPNISLFVPILMPTLKGTSNVWQTWPQHAGIFAVILVCTLAKITSNVSISNQFLLRVVTDTYLVCTFLKRFLHLAVIVKRRGKVDLLITFFITSQKQISFGKKICSRTLPRQIFLLFCGRAIAICILFSTPCATCSHHS